MKRRPGYLIAVLLIVIGWNAALGLASIAKAHEPSSGVCGDFNGDYPIAWLVCSWQDTNDRIDALEARVASLESQLSAIQRNGPGVTRSQAEEIAWSKAGDRLQLWKNDSAAYRDHWFYDQLFLRWRTHECRSGQPIPYKCP